MFQTVSQQTAPTIQQPSILGLSTGSKWIFVVLLFIFMFAGLTALWFLNTQQASTGLITLVTLLALFSGVGLLGFSYVSWRHYTKFSQDIHAWANKLEQGDLSSRMLVNEQTTSDIRLLINKISDDYESLSIFQQQRFMRQAERIEQKKYFLDILYDVSKTINKSNDLEDLLQKFLVILTDMVKAKAATIRLLDKEGNMRLVASTGLNQEIIKLEETLPSPECLCGAALKNKEVLINSNVNQCSAILGIPFFEQDDATEMFAIPLQYRDKTLGVYNLFMNRNKNHLLEGEHELLVSIGQHLGMAIEQAGVEEDAKSLSIIQERTRMAHELHDSLAQTLATLRIKIRLFDDSLQQSGETYDSPLWAELNELENTIENAYSELRSLITHFRAPIDGKGVVRAAQRLVDRFQQETGVEVFFYHNWELQNLDTNVEIEVVRIIQEALTNVKKHAQAENVRILMISTADGSCSVLVEDDGIGLDRAKLKHPSNTGEHIGLSVMQERAERINGEIQFEDDGGEGTLVQLNFQVPTADHAIISVENIH